MSSKKLVNIYLEFINDYLTVDKYAEHKGLGKNEALTLLCKAKDAHQQESYRINNSFINKPTFC